MVIDPNLYIELLYIFILWPTIRDMIDSNVYFEIFNLIVAYMWLLDIIVS